MKRAIESKAKSEGVGISDYVRWVLANELLTTP
jgi:hypothetical protein